MTSNVPPLTQRLYDWERNHVEPRANRFLSRDECRDLAMRAAAYAGIRTPEVRFLKSARVPCRAVPSHWGLEIADWGRNPTTVLHEVAHLATLDAVRAGEDPHGPSFVAMAMDFYERFLGIDRATMERTAAAVGLQVGEGRRTRRPEQQGGMFDDLEF